jgi:dihydrofolate synthase/folylpolyglutamate synthase
MADSCRLNAHASLDEWLAWQSGLHPHEIDLGLTRVTQVAQRLDLQFAHSKILIVAGTNGKGSSLAMTASILRAAGFSTGRFSSPHLVHYNERILINDQPVSDAQLTSVFDLINRSRGEISLTFFEFSTLAALVLFSLAKVEFVLLEVGLGGRLDAVNCVDADAVLITSIDLDHQAYLGDTREKIGFEKAGVMRAGKPAICSDPLPPQSLVDHAHQLGAELRCLGRDFCYEVHQDGAWRLSVGSNTYQLDAPGLKGHFQYQNASGVIALMLATGWVSDWAVINRGLSTAHLSGRLQQFTLGRQKWLLDVAHNPQSISVLVDYIEQQAVKVDRVLFGQMQDKDVVQGLEILLSSATLREAQWSLPELRIERAFEPNRLKSLFPEGIHCQVVSSLESQVQEWLKSAPAEREERILVLGSFYIVGPVLAILQAETNDDR